MAQIFCFGDSITYGVGGEEGGWADLLKRELHKKAQAEERYHVYNLGVPGDTALMVGKRLESETVARRWHDVNFILILSVGTNDSKAQEDGISFGTTIEEYKSNLGKLFNEAKSLTDKIICLGLTPVDEDKTRPYGSGRAYFSNKRLLQFDEAFTEVCKKAGLQKIELFQKMSNNQYKKMLSDGLHPNAEGYKWIYSQLRPEVMKLLES